jgi:hypothetical protein
VVLADLVKSPDWRARRAAPRGQVSPAELAAIRAKLTALIGQSVFTVTGTCDGHVPVASSQFNTGGHDPPWDETCGKVRRVVGGDVGFMLGAFRPISFYLTCCCSSTSVQRF